MAHKPIVEIDQEWSDLTGLIDSYSSSNSYNIQLLTTGKVQLCISATDPTYTPIYNEVYWSYTVAEQHQVVNLASGVAGCWAKMLDSQAGKLSIEEV